MTTQQDVTAMIKDVMGGFPVDTKAMADAFKTQATLNEKLSGVALGAAEKSSELSAKWTSETLAKIGDLAKVKAEPADYAKAYTDFASAQAEATANQMTAFAEIAQNAHADAFALLMAAGKDAAEDATAAVKKATADATANAKKATAAAK